jgi:phenylacetate-CoA ligase
MNANLVKYLFFPLHERAKGKQTLACLRELERTQWWSDEELYTFRLRKLRSFLQYAYDSVPYYNRLFNKCGFVSSQVKDFDDLQKIPFLTKEIIRQNLEALRSKIFQGKMQLISTGGSTGEPVAVYCDMNRSSWDSAAQLRCQKWFGIDVGEKEAVLWGSPIEITKQDRIRKLRDYFVNTRLMSAFNMSEQSLESYLMLLKRWNPSKIYCYASVISVFAKYLLDQKLIFPIKSLKAIFPTAEPLYDFQRKVIQKAFGCPVSIEYGSRDAGAIAHECPERGLHLEAENIIVEIMSGGHKSSEGKSGEIVVTNMSTMGMPLIRYRTGDIGTISNNSCSCGRSLPLLGKVEGRSTDFIIGHDGRLIHALSVIYILREINTIKQFRVIQEAKDLVVVEVVGYSVISERDVSYIRVKIKELLQNDPEVQVKCLDQIKTLPSGKHRYVISKIAPDWLKNGETA